MVRQLTRPYFIESCGSEMLLWRCYTTTKASQFKSKLSKIILAETNFETFSTYIGYAISFKHIFQTCFKVICQNCENGFTICLCVLCFMIIARFLPVFPHSTFIIMKSCSKSIAEKQGKIWWLVARWGGWGVP